MKYEFRLIFSVVPVLKIDLESSKVPVESITLPAKKGVPPPEGSSSKYVINPQAGAYVGNSLILED